MTDKAEQATADKTSNETSPAPSTLGAGDAFMAVAVFMWGVNFPVAKFVLGHMEPMVFSASRYLAAALFLFALLALRKIPMGISKREAAHLFLLGMLGVTLFQGGWAIGLSLTTASKASILVATGPVFGAILSGFTGHWPSRKAWTGIVLSLLGVTLIINNSLTSVNLGGGTLIGDLLIIAAAALWALYTLASGPILMSRGPLLVTAWGMLFGALVLCVIAAPGMLRHDWTAMPAIVWGAWTFNAVIGAALAFLLYYEGVARLGITRGMVYGYFIPVVAVITSVVFFGETMSLIQIGGALIVLFGVRLTRAN